MRNRSAWRHPLAIGLYLLLTTWILLPLLSEESGFRFGLGYRIFFTVMIIAGVLFFLLLEQEQLPVPTSRGGVLLSIVAVYLLTVGILTLSGTVYPFPQFAIPTPVVAGGEVPSKPLAEQGRDLFFASIGGISCAQCHVLEGKGGKRGPAMDDFAARARQAIDEGRYPDVSLEEYTRQHILEGSAYFHSDPRYPPIMPPLKSLLSEEQVNALVAFLVTTGGSGAPVLAAQKPAPIQAPPEATPTEAEAEAMPTEAAPLVEEGEEEEGEGEEEGATVDAAAALEVVQRTGCFACHAIPGAPEPPTPVGPDLSDIGARKDADYIRRSILEPNADIAEECPAGPCPSPSIMPPAGAVLSQEELDLLVAYLTTLTGE